MAEYYYGEAARKPKRKSLIVTIVDYIMMVVSAVVFAAMALTLVTSYYDPSVSWIFPVVGLVTPAIFIATTLLMLYWVIRWRLSLVAVMLLPLLVAAPNISHYAKIDPSKHYGEISRRGTTRLLSYNTHGFTDENGVKTPGLVADFLDEQRPDVICFQEFNKGHFAEDSEPKFMRNYARSLCQGQAIFSRYKILDESKDLLAPHFSSGGAFWADILVNEDTVRLYNIHLHSTSITSNDDNYLSNMEFISDSLSEDKFRGMVTRFRTSAIGRAAQADTIARSIAQSPHKVIVCGDFNDTPNSYAFRKISKGLQDTFQESGSGYSYTFRGFMNLLRIDYILVEKPIDVLHYEVVDSVALSDHLPVITTLKI